MYYISCIYKDKTPLVKCKIRTCAKHFLKNHIAQVLWKATFHISALVKRNPTNTYTGIHLDFTYFTVRFVCVPPSTQGVLIAGPDKIDAVVLWVHWSEEIRGSDSPKSNCDYEFRLFHLTMLFFLIWVDQ